MSPVPLPQRVDPAAYSKDRELLPSPLQPTPVQAYEGGRGSLSAAPAQSSSAFLQQGLDSATADLPSSQQQADSLKASLYMSDCHRVLSHQDLQLSQYMISCKAASAFELAIQHGRMYCVSAGVEPECLVSR